MNVKDLLYIEEMLKNKNESKTGDAMEKTEVNFFYYYFCILLFQFWRLP